MHQTSRRIARYQAWDASTLISARTTSSSLFWAGICGIRRKMVIMSPFVAANLTCLARIESRECDLWCSQYDLGTALTSPYWQCVSSHCASATAGEADW